MHPTVPTSERGHLNHIARGLLRFANGNLLAVGATGRDLALRHASATAPALRRLLLALDLSDQAQHLDQDGAMEGMSNQLAALFHVWTEKLGICPAFFEELGLLEDSASSSSEQRAYQYRLMAKSTAAAMIQKGGTLAEEEFQAATRNAQRELGSRPRARQGAGPSSQNRACVHSVPQAALLFKNKCSLCSPHA